VNWTDFQKAVYQIHDTAFRFKKSHKGDTVVPVVAFPARLQKELVKFDNWDSLRDLCQKVGVAVWVIESASVREIQDPTTKVTKTRSVKARTVKMKTTKVKRAKPKSKTVKSTKVKGTTTKTTKPKAVKAKTTKSKAVKASTRKAKTPRTKATKPKSIKAKK